MGDKLHIPGSVFVLGALWLLVIPPAWGIGAVLAVSIHELSHLIAVLLCGGQVLSISLQPWGAMMETTPLTPIQEAFCALAGPVGSFLTLLMAEFFPEAALCGLFQGAYNLLPIYPLDGGRISRCVLPQPLYRSLEASALTFFTGCSIWLMTIEKELAVIFLFSLWIPVFRRKSSCKEPLLAVQ